MPVNSPVLDFQKVVCQRHHKWRNQHDLVRAFTSRHVQDVLTARVLVEAAFIALFYLDSSKTCRQSHSIKIMHSETKYTANKTIKNTIVLLNLTVRFSDNQPEMLTLFVSADGA